MRTAGNLNQESRSMLEEATALPQELVQEYPLTSTLLAFGVGVGVGVLVGQTIGDALIGCSEAEPAGISSFGRKLVETVRSTITETMGRFTPQ